MMTALTTGTNHVFVNLPGVCGPQWTPEVRRMYRKQYGDRSPHPEQNWIYLNINGTTFSGLSVKTTLGNTLRSLFYMWFYLRSLVPRGQYPWENKSFFVMASGDDIVVFAHPSIA